MPSIAFVVARSHPENVIGCENRLPWKLRTDMQFFKNVTEHHAVIMGRKTFDSIGRPLPNRMNIVISRSEGNSSNNLIWVKDRESALFFADFYSIAAQRTQLIIIGGEQVYEVFEDLVNKIFLTEVFAKFPDGDARFDFSIDHRKWKTIDEKDYLKSEIDEFPFRISVYERRLKTVRQRDISEFLVPDKKSSNWLDSQFMQKAGRFERLPPEQFKLPIAEAANF